MIEIRPERAEDHAAIYEVNKRAFNQEDEAQLIERIRTSPHFIPVLPFVAVKAGKIVGHILFSSIIIKTPTNSVSALLLAPMAVLPEFQRQGIGSLLIKKGLEECRCLGHEIVVVIGHPEYYPRFGFSSARAKKLHILFKVPDEAFLVLELIPGVLDNVRGVVEFPSPFDGMM